MRAIGQWGFLIGFATLAFSPISVAQINDDDYKTFFPTNSGKEIELQIADGLQRRLKVNYIQQLVNDDPNDIRIVFQFAENKEIERPTVIISIDTAVLARRKGDEGVPISQTIKVSSIGDISLDSNNEVGLLRWTNSWNARDFPFRVYFKDGRLTVSQVMTTTQGLPVSEQHVTGAFTGVLQIWSIIAKELEVLKLLAK